MCLLLFAYKVHPQFPFILAANRDEFYDRPTAKAHFWNDHPDILGGRDLEKMGTWIGVSKYGKFAALTNYRDPNQSKEGKHSRGELASNFLSTNQSINDYSKELQATTDQYQKYNLIFGNTDNLYYFSNVTNELKILSPGIYGLSNHLLNTNWPKVMKGRNLLQECITDVEKVESHCLFHILTDHTIAPDYLLPHTGVSIELERTLSPLFVQTHNYGTVSSTILMLSKRKDITFIERSFTHTREFNEQNFSFAIIEDTL